MLWRRCKGILCSDVCAKAVYALTSVPTQFMLLTSVLNQFMLWRPCQGGLRAVVCWALYASGSLTMFGNSRFSPKHHYVFTRLLAVISQKTSVFTLQTRPNLVTYTVGIYCKNLTKLQCTVWGKAGGLYVAVTMDCNELRLSILRDTDLCISLTVRFKRDFRLLLRGIWAFALLPLGEPDRTPLYIVCRPSVCVGLRWRWPYVFPICM
jgi:hypothetical protein